MLKWNCGSWFLLTQSDQGEFRLYLNYFSEVNLYLNSEHIHLLFHTLTAKMIFPIYMLSKFLICLFVLFYHIQNISNDPNIQT